ncbi:MAG: NADH-quinone oxidoreductase subunit NuoE [Dermatophilaceae bacterium]
MHVSAESKKPYAADVLEQLRADAEIVMARYPHPRSALLPMLHLVQAVDSYVTGRGVVFCAELLGLTEAEVSGVASFYTQYKRHPNGEYTVGVCTNTLCAIMGGDLIFDRLSEHLGVGHDETTEDGKITLERLECNAACDYAPVVMANWEFFDNQTPESALGLVDDLTAGKDIHPTRGADTVCTFKQASRVLAGFPDGRANEGVSAGPASLLGLKIAQQNGWRAPGDDDSGDQAAAESGDSAPAASGDSAPAESALHPPQSSIDSPSKTGSGDTLPGLGDDGGKDESK